MKLNNLLLGLVVLVGSVAILISAVGFAAIPGQAYGAGTMPRAIGILGLGIGGWIIAEALRAGERRPRFRLQPWTRSRTTMLTVAAAPLAVVLYILLADPLGYLPVAFVLLTGLMLVRRVPVATAVIVALVAAVVIQQTFGRLLLVPIPRSPLLGFMW